MQFKIQIIIVLQIYHLSNRCKILDKKMVILSIFCEKNRNPWWRQRQQQRRQSSDGKRIGHMITSFKCLIPIFIVYIYMLSTLLHDEIDNTNYNNNGMKAPGAARQNHQQQQQQGKTSMNVPYYLIGKTKYQQQEFHRRRTFQLIQNEIAQPIDINNNNDNNNSQSVWVLRDPIHSPTRNHESILLEYMSNNNDDDNNNNDNKGGAGVGDGNDKQILINVLGRYSRGIQWMDLITGEQNMIITNGTDPDRRPLNDLNHVASVVVDSIDAVANDDKDNMKKRKEIWLPCGFHNDRVGKELSSNYVRIVDLETMKVRVGPKLPFSGGACAAASIEAVPHYPPFICAFGGTNGNHDTGIFLPYVSCYDRSIEKWVYPFGKLPMGMDHLSIAVVPKGACNPQDPSRVLVFNFRTKNYSTHTSAEILAFDLPKDGWTRDFLNSTAADTEGSWYTFANHTFDGAHDEVYAPRDASGVVMANDGRSVVNFGGINQVRNPLWSKKKKKVNGPKVFSTWYSTVRELNVCTKRWQKVADMGIQTFALMASASTKLNAAFFCGGSMYRQDFNGNTQLCLAIRIQGLNFWNHRSAAVENFPPKFNIGAMQE